MSELKSVYVCGPLTELPWYKRWFVKRFYERVGMVATAITGIPAFVPHRYYDPIRNAAATPHEVYVAEYEQVAHRTSHLVVIAIEPSWGGGVEVQIANEHGVPVIILHPAKKTISRLVRGGPAIQTVLPYTNKNEALILIKWCCTSSATP